MRPRRTERGMAARGGLCGGWRLRARARGGVWTIPATTATVLVRPPRSSERRRTPPRSRSGAAIVAGPSSAQQGLDARRFVDRAETHILTRWMEGFYPIYAVAQRTFGVNWLLLASIHMQESAFSTAPSTYHGLNFAGCCGGPMQFNVTNGPVST